MNVEGAGSRTELAAAVEANLVAQYLAFRSRLESLDIEEAPDLVRVTCEVAHPYFNCVLRARLDAERAAARIDEVLSFFAARRRPVAWITGPSTQPAELGKLLLGRGLCRAREEPGMARGLESILPPMPAPVGFQVRPVEDARSLAAWLDIVGVAFGYPRLVLRAFSRIYRGVLRGNSAFRLYLGWLGSEPVATGRLFPRDGVAGIYHVGTVPRLRRLGIGSVVTLAAMSEGRRLGCRVAVLRASPLGLGAYRRLGFEPCCTIGSYTQSATAG